MRIVERESQNKDAHKDEWKLQLLLSVVVLHELHPPSNVVMAIRIPNYKEDLHYTFCRKYGILGRVRCFDHALHFCF